MGCVMNILILYGRFGMGHMQTAKSIARQLEMSGQGHNVRCVDFFDYTGKGDLVYKAFNFIVRKGEGVFNRVYNVSNEMGSFGLPMKSYCYSEFSRLLDECRPQMIISTLPFTSLLAGRYKAKFGKDYKLVTCITDINIHGDWVAPGTDAYLAPSVETKSQLCQMGVPQSHIFVSGVPLNPAFSRELPESSTHAHQTRRLLIMGGGLGLISDSMDFYDGLNRLPNVETTVVCAGNTKLYEALKGRFENVRALGFVEHMAALMRESDLLLGKPGGVTVFEAIACRLPFLALKPFLSQEISNGQFILNHGLGDILAAEPEKSLGQISDILWDFEGLCRIKSNMRALEAGFDRDAIFTLCRLFSESFAA